MKKVSLFLAFLILLNSCVIASAEVHYADRFQVEDINGDVHFIDRGSSGVSSRSAALWTGVAVMLGTVIGNIITDRYISQGTPQSQTTVTQVSDEKYMQYEEDIKTITRVELNNIATFTKQYGIESVISTLSKYCEKNGIVHSSSILNGSLSYLVKFGAQENTLLNDISFNYIFDTNKKYLTVRVRAPFLKIMKEQTTAYTEPIPSDLHAFGLSLTSSAYLCGGYCGYVIKDIRPYSKAAILGFKQYDQIIKIDNHSVDINDTQEELLKNVNRQLYKNKYPVQVDYMRNGIINRTVLIP